MKYQLVLQLPAGATADFDALVRIEIVLMNRLGEHSSLDGHDMGSGEMNIFVHTDKPEAAFEVAKEVLKRRGMLASARAAYRDRNEESYTILWPPGLRSFTVK